MSGVGGLILRPPKAAVDVQQNGVRSLRARQTHFEKPIGVGAICHTLIRWRLRAAENVFGGHGFLPVKRLKRIQIFRSRPEEPTSALQSLTNLVCRLLL